MTLEEQLKRELIDSIYFKGAYDKLEKEGLDELIDEMPKTFNRMKTYGGASMWTGLGLELMLYCLSPNLMVMAGIVPILCTVAGLNYLYHGCKGLKHYEKYIQELTK